MQTAAGTINGSENMDTGSSGASIWNDEFDLPKFVAFKSLSKENYLRPDGIDNYIVFMDVDAISWGVKHEVQKAKCGGGLIHIKCCDTGKYWSWGEYIKRKWIVAEADEPEEDELRIPCTLVKPSQRTKDGVSIVKFQLIEYREWCSIGEGLMGHLGAGCTEFVIIDWASIVNEKMDLPNFVVFQSLSDKKYVRPGGVHRYMKSEADDVVRWGVKHEIKEAKYEEGLVHIRCCDTGKYWSWGQTEDSRKFITTQVDQPGEDTRTRACTLIKPSHHTNGSVILEVMYLGKWLSLGVYDGGHLRYFGNDSFIISDWKSFEANQLQNTDTGGFGASIGNEELHLPKIVVINSVMNKKYLSLDDYNHIRFNAVDIQSSSIKHEI